MLPALSFTLTGFVARGLPPAACPRASCCQLPRISHGPQCGKRRKLVCDDEGCRLEDALLALVKVAAAKLEAGQRVRITTAEYVARLQAACASPPSDEPDVLGLRKRRRLSGAAAEAKRVMRARARMLLFAKRFSDAGAGSSTDPV